MSYSTILERRAELQSIRSLLDHIIGLNQRAGRVANAYHGTTIATTQAESDVQEILDDLGPIRTQLDALLTAVDTTYAAEVWVGDTGTEYSYAVIDVDNGSSKGSITAKDADGNTASTAPFAVFAAGDTVEIIQAEDSSSLGTYTVDAGTSSTVLLFTAVIGGSDNAADTQLRLVKRTDA